jgi:hypothetical protein
MSLRGIKPQSAEPKAFMSYTYTIIRAALGPTAEHVVEDMEALTIKYPEHQLQIAAVKSAIIGVMQGLNGNAVSNWDLLLEADDTGLRFHIDIRAAGVHL